MEKGEEKGGEWCVCFRTPSPLCKQVSQKSTSVQEMQITYVTALLSLAKLHWQKLHRHNRFVGKSDTGKCHTGKFKPLKSTLAIDTHR